jgi:MFS family permease
MSGRLGWATISDKLGRKNTYYLFGLGIPLCIAIPSMTAAVTSAHHLAPLLLFYSGVITVVSFYGGLFSVLPAYLADIFGPKHVGAIHGRALTAWSAAAVLGPMLMTTLRHNAFHDALWCDAHRTCAAVSQHRLVCFTLCV